MVSTNMRVYNKTYSQIDKIAHQLKISKQEALDQAVESYRRELFLREANNAYAALRNDPEAWQNEKEEREAWDYTIQDGLEDDR